MYVKNLFQIGQERKKCSMAGIPPISGATTTTTRRGTRAGAITTTTVTEILVGDTTSTTGPPAEVAMSVMGIPGGQGELAADRPQITTVDQASCTADTATGLPIQTIHHTGQLS